jgi:hypothetical protein
MYTTVTVEMVRRDRYRVKFSILPGRSFGDWPFAEVIRDLRVATTLSGLDARDLVLEAAATGSASRQTTTG